MSFEEYKKNKGHQGCTECGWGSAMTMIIQNEVLNNPSFREKLLREMKISSIKILRNGRIFKFDA